MHHNNSRETCVTIQDSVMKSTDVKRMAKSADNVEEEIILNQCAEQETNQIIYMIQIEKKDQKIQKGNEKNEKN